MYFETNCCLKILQTQKCVKKPTGNKFKVNYCNILALHCRRLLNYESLVPFHLKTLVIIGGMDKVFKVSMWLSRDITKTQCELVNILKIIESVVFRL